MRPKFRALKSRLEDIFFIQCKLTGFCVTSTNIAKNLGFNVLSKQIELL